MPYQEPEMGPEIYRSACLIRPIYLGMKDSVRENTGKQQDFGSENIIAGYIASALDIEDQVVEGIYTDYVKREAWPASMKEEAFQSIRTYLEILIKDSARHKKTVLSLQDRLNADNTD
jgi:hypothetical protein